MPLGYTWYTKSSAEDSNHTEIIRYSVSDRMQIPDNIRQTVLHNGSLLIHNLVLDDTKYYTVEIAIIFALIFRGGGQLTVYEKLAKLKIAVNDTNILEDESLILTCSTENVGANIGWFFNDQPQSLDGRMSTFENNQILLIKGVKREDAGSYQCEAWNPANAKKSDALTLTVSSSESPERSNGATLSGGAITVVVIGVLAGVALLGALIYVLITKNTGRGKKDLPRGEQSAPRYREDTTVYENTVHLKGLALPAQGLDSSSTSPEVLDESPYQMLDVTRVDVYEKITSWKNPEV
ncbi:carcinoembryonic antigen-related cell adhesion molecule 21-like [Monodelphis domestica]|uniref:carcinoembryonic antigen-related cell adhesion molecule 21-like n=1 Tax=Monodelphis domestica TaxID=13616 RepID=UPI0024E1C3A5|nr:carcinoembryonic antigen-related cell adhesion molecule 21-like [Monodelphis domestica]